MATAVPASDEELPVTRPPFSDDQNRFLQYFVTFSTMPSWIASGIILLVLLKERRVRLTQTYHRLILGLSLYDFSWSLHFSIFGGHWTIPAVASDWVVGADADTWLWCNVSGVIFYHYLGTVMYSSSLMIYFVMDVHWQWSKDYITRKMEPLMHIVSNFVPWIHGVVAVGAQALVPSPKLPGICYIREWPPDCETENNPVRCTRGDAEGTAITATLTTMAFFGWFIIMVISMTSLTSKVWKVERRMHAYASASSTELNLTRQTAVRGILYVMSAAICTLPAVPFNFSFWDLNEEYRHVHFTLALFICCLTGNQGVFNAFIYLRPYFKDLTRPNGTLFFLRPVRVAVERYPCCVFFWTCQCCHCCVQAAMDAGLFFSSTMQPSSQLGTPSEIENASVVRPRDDKNRRSVRARMSFMRRAASTMEQPVPAWAANGPSSTATAATARIHRPSNLPSDLRTVTTAPRSVHATETQQQANDEESQRQVPPAKVAFRIHDEDEVKVDGEVEEGAPAQERAGNKQACLDDSSVNSEAALPGGIIASSRSVNSEEALPGGIQASPGSSDYGSANLESVDTLGSDNDDNHDVESGRALGLSQADSTCTLESDEEEATGWLQAPIFVREGFIHASFSAPAGPLGIFLKESSYGPIVWTISEHSSVRDRLQVGDVLVAVDQFSTRWMAIENVVGLITGSRVQQRITVERLTYPEAIMDRQEVELVFEAEEEEDQSGPLFAESPLFASDDDVR